eukprot:758959-Hanusia_phi.AAC.1
MATRRKAWQREREVTGRKGEMGTCSHRKQRFPPDALWKIFADWRTWCKTEEARKRRSHDRPANISRACSLGGRESGSCRWFDKEANQQHVPFAESACNARKQSAPCSNFELCEYYSTLLSWLASAQPLAL